MYNKYRNLIFDYILMGVILFIIIKNKIEMNINK
jgi:hypothetical protein